MCRRHFTDPNSTRTRSKLQQYNLAGPVVSSAAGCQGTGNTIPTFTVYAELLSPKHPYEAPVMPGLRKTATLPKQKYDKYIHVKNPQNFSTAHIKKHTLPSVLFPPSGPVCDCSGGLHRLKLPIR